MQLTIFGITYSFTTAPDFVKHHVRLLSEKWTANLATAPVFVQHEAKLLADKWGVPA